MSGEMPKRNVESVERNQRDENRQNETKISICLAELRNVSGSMGNIKGWR